MTERQIVKKYDKDGFKVVWKPKMCIHSEICVKTLPEVYKPDQKPWIQPENASVAALKNQIDRCPSGALSYEMQGEATAAADSNAIKADIIKGGPLIIKGALEVTDSAGNIKKMEGNTAFCRCGASSNKPLCDGSHRKIEFD